MTVTEIEFDIDLALMVGPMNALPCEHFQHAIRPTHSGSATHYVIGRHEECGYSGQVEAVCEPYVLMVRQDIEMFCRNCHADVWASDVLTILGPVGG